MGEYVTFCINSQTFGVDMLNVEKIIKFSKISPIPDSPDYLEGVIEFQSSLIPVINLKKAFNLPVKDVPTDSSVIIISYNNEKKAGIISDYVNDIIKISEDDLLKIQNNKYIYGLAKVENIIVNILNSNSLITGGE